MHALRRALYCLLFSCVLASCQKDPPPENQPPVVNAGNAQTVILSPATGDSVSLSGTAADADGSVASYLWSEVSGPNKAIILTPGAPSTFITGLASGAYVFQLMATDNKGAVGVGTVTITVTQNHVPHNGNKPPVVTAGQDTTFDLTNATSDSIRVAGSASDSDGRVVSYLWSQVSGPNMANIRNPGSAATAVSSVVSGKYVFQLMATDNDGATGVKTVTITVINPQNVTVTLQSRDHVTDLHFIYNYLGSSNDTSAAEIGASAWTNSGSPAYQRGLLKFDLSFLPADATIQSAKLTLYSNPHPKNGDLVHANSGPNNTMLIQRVTSGWDMTTTWQTQPSTETTAQVVIPQTDQPFLDLINVDVTDAIKRMTQLGNYGFMIKLQNEVAYNSRIFCSTKYPDASKHPKLVLQYRKY